MTEQILAETVVSGYVAPVFTVVRSRRQPRQSGEWAPAINVFDTGRAFVVIAELAGVGPDSLRIELDTHGDRLTLRGTRTTRSPGESVDEEISSGRFERSIAFDAPLDADGARAICRYGLLELMIPKLPQRAWKGEKGGGGGIRTLDTLAGIAV